MQDRGETLAAIADKLLTLVCKWLRAGHIRALEWARAACALRTQPRAAAICAETTQAGRAEHTRADHRTEAGAAIATPTLAVRSRVMCDGRDRRQLPRVPRRTRRCSCRDACRCGVCVGCDLGRRGVALPPRSPPSGPLQPAAQLPDAPCENSHHHRNLTGHPNRHRRHVFPVPPIRP
jgi:hypothetical protein